MTRAMRLDHGRILSREAGFRFVGAAFLALRWWLSLGGWCRTGAEGSRLRRRQGCTTTHGAVGERAIWMAWALPGAVRAIGGL